MIDLDTLTDDELLALEIKISARRRHLNRERVRTRQLKELADGRSTLECQGGATINSFCDDLVFHAKRLGRPIEGSFNDFLLKANPDSSALHLCQLYCEERPGMERD